MKYFKIIIMVCILSLCATSCKKSKKAGADSSPAEAPTGTYMLHIHTMLDTNEVEEYGVTYTTTGGRKISLSLSQLYLSEIELVKADGSIVPFAGTRILKVLDKETYIVGTTPVGNYKGLRFKIGVNPDKQDPSAAGNSETLNRPEMWFSNNPQQDGYVFMNVAGKVDTTYNASGAESQMQSFSYRVGTANNYKPVIMPGKNFTILADQVEYGHMQIDYMQLFRGIQLNDHVNLSVANQSDNSTTIAAKIASNIPYMFKYED